MRVFLIGGSGFTGPALIQQLVERDHEVFFLHRGQTNDPRTSDATELIGDRKDTNQLREAIVESSPDIVVDMIPFTAEEAETTKSACRDVVSRVVALSSIDVYLAYGIIKLTESTPGQTTPMTETSALRTSNQPDGPTCDKIAVEQAFMSDSKLAATILRLPAIYGPRDKYRRFRSYLKRMDDGRRALLLGESIANWKFSRGFVDNVARAIVLAIENEEAAGEIFNVAEPTTLTETEFVRAIGEAAGWDGEIKVVPDSVLPPYLQPKVNFQQDWEVDSTKIRSQLGYAETVDISDAYRKTIEWERANPPDTEPYEMDYEKEDAALAQATNGPPKTPCDS